MIPGYDRLMKQLKEIAAKKHVEAKKAVMQAVFDDSQTRVPVDKGDLKESGRFDENLVSYGTDHAIHIEFGTINMEAQPYLRPAYEGKARQLAEIAAQEINKEIREVVR